MGLMSDNAEDVGLALLAVEGIAHGLAIDGQALVVVGHLRVPALQGAVQGRGVDTREHVTDAGAAGHLVAAVTVAATKTRAGLLAEILGPSGDGLVTARTAEYRGGGNRQHHRQGMPASLATTRVGDPGEEGGKRTHVLGR